MTRYLINVEINDEATTTTTTSDCFEYEYENDIPENFICPLTLQIYTDPLMSRSGKNFERKAIIEWLDRGNPTCPLTRQPLGLSLLVPNARLRIEVEEWKRKHGYKIKTRDDNNNNNNNNNNETQIMKNQQFLCTIDTDILHSILQEDHENRQGRGTTTHSEDDNIHQRRRRIQRRRRDARSTTEFSPTTQRRGFITLLGEALNTVRRPSLTG
jgi:hypothetical protein